jgi:hypothetical protein
VKNEVDSHGAPVFAPDYGATVLATKMCTNANVHSMNVIWFWLCFVLKLVWCQISEKVCTLVSIETRDRRNRDLEFP